MTGVKNIVSVYIRFNWRYRTIEDILIHKNKIEEYGLVSPDGKYSVHETIKWGRKETNIF